MDGKIWWKSFTPLNRKAVETPWESAKNTMLGFMLVAALCIIFAFFVAVFSMLFSSCATASTPALPRREPFTPQPIERVMVEKQEDDATQVEVDLGSMRQALADSDALDGAIQAANTAQMDLLGLTVDYDILWDWTEEQKKLNRVRTGVVAGGLIVTFVGGLVLGLNIRR